MTIQLPIEVRDFLFQPGMSAGQPASNSSEPASLPAAPELSASARANAEAALRAEILAQRNEVAELQRGILQSLQHAIPDLVHRAERQLVDLAFAVTRKVLGEAPVTVETVAAAVREALAPFQAQPHGQAQCQCYVHPQDLALLQQYGFESPEGIQFVSSADIERGGCLIKSPLGTVDAQPSAKLRQLQQVLCK